MPGDRALGLRYRTSAIRAYDPRWVDEFESEAARLRSILGSLVSGIEHVGSTAVPGLPAKPIIDIAIAYRDTATVAEIQRLLETSGYEFRGDAGDHGGLVFVRGPEPLFRTHHLHLVDAESRQWRQYLTFRDALRRDPARRDQYATLKHELAARFPLDRPSYQAGKANFIEETIVQVEVVRFTPRRGGRQGP